MSIYRSYFKKNNTLIKNGKTNNSLNPISEISYGTVNQSVSRFIFDVTLDALNEKVLNGEINQQNILRHTLHLTNTIAYYPEFLGKKSYDETINRASSFQLDLFNISEDWDDGSGYNFIYDTTFSQLYPTGATNWFKRTTLLDWNTPGIYNSGTTEIVSSQYFTQGNENIEIDVTDYINSRIFTGITGFTGTTTGLGLKFTDNYEQQKTTFRNAVAFFAKDTNTFYEPYIETIIDDQIIDDRNYFYLDKDNNLFLYSNIGNKYENIVVNYIAIYDYNDTLITTLSGNSITNVSKGIYKISLKLDSDLYPDAVIFKDVWNITVGNKIKDIEQEFFLISNDNYFNFNTNIINNKFNPNNYHFKLSGILENEKIIAGDVKNIKINVKELYPNQNNFIPLDIEYRIFVAIADKYELNVIPFTGVNITNEGYEFNIDTSWLITQDYYLELRLMNNNVHYTKNKISFSVINDKIK